MAAAGVVCLQEFGQYGDWRIAKNMDVISEAIHDEKFDTAGQRGRSPFDAYTLYYVAQALYQVGGEPWKAWNTAMEPAIIDHQRKDGDQRGSWDPVGAWGGEGGRIYSTAMGVLSLEVYYRYSRLFSTRRGR